MRNQWSGLEDLEEAFRQRELAREKASTLIALIITVALFALLKGWGA
jgi:hypothetical protein